MDKLDKLFDTLVTYLNLEIRKKNNDPDRVTYTYKDDKITLLCKIGEQSGGNCWGGVSSYESLSYISQDFNIVDTLLLAIDPNVTLKTYNDIKKLIQSERICINEYYGNANYYYQSILEKDDLFNALKKTNININDSIIDKIDDDFTNLYLATLETKQISSKQKYKSYVK